jgi:hypothetical protein
LSEILEAINEKVGLNLGPGDMLSIDQVNADLLDDELLAEQVRTNSKDQVRPVFKQRVVPAFLERRMRNEQVVDVFIENAEIRELIVEYMLEDAYRKVRGGDRPTA